MSVVAVAVLSTSALYADNSRNESGSMNGASGMMGRMGQTHRMMEGCSRMMGMSGSGSERPNEQWRKRAPSRP